MQMQKSGLTLIELMVVISLLGIIAAFAIPKLLESKKTVNENSALSALRTISSAEEFYNTRFQKYGTLANMSTANMIDNVLAAASTVGTAKSGFYFDLSLSVSRAAWTCIARPAEWGITGERNFKIDQRGLIMWNADAGSSTFTTALGQQ